jgi:hypothetical protein
MPCAPQGVKGTDDDKLIDSVCWIWNVRKMHLFRNYLPSSHTRNSFKKNWCHCNSTQIIICNLEGNLWERQTMGSAPSESKAKVIPVQAWAGPEGSRSLGLSGFLYIIRKRSWFGCQPYAPAGFTLQEITLVITAVTGWVDPRAIVRPEWLSQWKIHWSHRGSNPRPSDL